MPNAAAAAKKMPSPNGVGSKKTTPAAAPPRAPTDDDVRRIADVAQASTHSVWKRLAGAVVKGRVSKRIDAAIQAWRKES